MQHLIRRDVVQNEADGTDGVQPGRHRNQLALRQVQHQLHRANDAALRVTGHQQPPLPGPHAAGIALVRGDDADAATALAESCARMFARAERSPGTPEAIGFPQSFTRIRRECGHAERYGAPGVVLLGDAIHPVSPAGGQGANMAIADAVVLAKLILAREPDLVGAYEAARRRPNDRGIRPTRLATEVLAFEIGRAHV